MEYKVIASAIGIAIGFISYVPYYRNVLLGKTKPHTFSWLVWTIIVGIIAVGQFSDGGGVGAWVTAFTELAIVGILLLSFWKGEKNITRLDWVSFGAALFAIVPWIVTKDPLISVVLATMIDTSAFIPTLRKTLVKPHEETISTFFLSGIKFVFSIIALQHYSVVTLLFPAWTACINIGFATIIFVKRKGMSPA